MLAAQRPRLFVQQRLFRVSNQAMVNLPQGTLVILPPRLASTQPSPAKIIERSNPRDGPVTYTLQIGSVVIPGVTVEEIFDHVSPQALETFENESFKRLQVAEAAKEEAEKATRIKLRGLEWQERNNASSGDEEGGSHEGSTSVADEQKSGAETGGARGGRPRPGYAHFYPKERAKRASNGQTKSKTCVLVEIEQSPKRDRGRPRKTETDTDTSKSDAVSASPKRRRGRPRKTESSMPASAAATTAAAAAAAAAAAVPTSAQSTTAGEPSAAKRRKLVEPVSRIQSSSAEASSSEVHFASASLPLRSSQDTSAIMKVNSPVPQQQQQQQQQQQKQPSMQAAATNTKILINTNTNTNTATSLAHPPSSPATSSSSSSESYEIETILSHHLSDPETHSPDMGTEPIMLYQVKWVGYNEATWEPADSFEDAGVVEEYWEAVGRRSGVVVAGAGAGAASAASAGGAGGARRT